MDVPPHSIGGFYLIPRRSLKSLDVMYVRKGMGQHIAFVTGLPSLYFANPFQMAG